MRSETASLYTLPQQWVFYDTAAILDQLVEARSAAGILNRLPYLQQWIEQVHEEQLRLEAAGNTVEFAARGDAADDEDDGGGCCGAGDRAPAGVGEGPFRVIADFSDQEQDVALATHISPDVHLTRSQRQLRAADATYRWLRSQPADRPITSEFVLDIHRRMVTGCDDDHCEPGALRPTDWNVTFGTPRCRGAKGGKQCQVAFSGLCAELAGEFRQHDRIIQALAAHYHIGAMHPFGDGNGRTSRALEAFMLRHAGVSDLVMVSLSNYYYEHKDHYLSALAESRQKGHDLTPFLNFALSAVTARCNAVAENIVDHNKRTLFRQFAQSLFGQLRSPRRRVLAERQLQVLESLLDSPTLDITDLHHLAAGEYRNLKYPRRAWLRDFINLLVIGAIRIDEKGTVTLNLNWPQELSESELLRIYENLPSAVSTNHPAMAALSQLLKRRR